MYQSLRQYTAGQRGIVLPVVAVTMVVLAGATGLALDGGRLFLEQRRMQAAADAGALGGAHEMWRGKNDMAAQIRPSVVRNTQLNGYDESNATITINRPPASGPQAGDARFLEVIVERNVPTTFTRMLGPNAALVRARAVAGLLPAADMCLLALDPAASAAMRIRGNATINMSCGAMSNSASSSGFQVEGSTIISSSFRNAPYLTNNLAWGTSVLKFRGALYFPSQHISVEGTPDGSTPWGMIIGRTVDFAGDGTTVFNTPPAGEAPGVYRVTLVN
jgi:hypothetical protein